MAQRLNAYAECLDWDNIQARQDLLSTMSSLNLSPSIPYSPETSSYVPSFDWRPQQSYQSHVSASPMQVQQGFATQPPRMLRSPFVGSLFGPSGSASSSSWPSGTAAAASSYAETAYLPLHQQASSPPAPFYHQTPAYMSTAPGFGVFPAYTHGMPSSGMSGMFSGPSTTVPVSATVTPNVLQGGAPMPYPAAKPMPTAFSPQHTHHHPSAAQAGQSVSSISSDMAMTMSGTSPSTYITDEDDCLAPAPSYDSEFFSSPCSGFDEDAITESPTRIQSNLLLEPPSPSDAEAKDAYLLRAKAAGLSYREIKQKGNFKEAESTLRGRYRTITKAKQERVRKPVWKNEDIILLRRGVEVYAEITTKTRPRQPLSSIPTTTTPTGDTLMATETYQEMKVPWKKVATFIVENGGSYRFGNATCKKKWLELANAGLVTSPPPLVLARMRQEVQM